MVKQHTMDIDNGNCYPAHSKEKEQPLKNHNKREHRQEVKQIIATGTMSNLVGMFASVVVDRKIKTSFKIIGKADDKYFICEGVGGYSAKLFTLEDMKDWIFFRTLEDYDFAMNDYYRHDDFRFGYDFLKNNG